jgi:tetratricopeptide (TPR) repeat protein
VTPFVRVAFVTFVSGTAIAAAAQESASPLKFSFAEVAKQAGFVVPTIYGGQRTNKYLLETTGCGVAAFDYDGDGWLDLFVVNGTTLDGFPPGKEPTSHLYRNRRDGTFEDVTAKAGLALAGWGQGACTGDYDNDGHEDLFVTFWGQNRLFRNRGDGTFEETTRTAGLEVSSKRWGAGCAFLDYDRDGRLDLFAASYIDLDLATAPVPESGLCRYKGVPVACGPPGLPGAKNSLFRNAGGGKFTDVSDSSGITRASGTYSLGVSTVDFDDDGWVDLYVANDSNPSALYRNNRDGTFTDVGVTAGCAYSQDGKPQAGMGVAVGDYNRDGRMDIFKTNFAGDTSTLYANAGNLTCEDRTFASGVGRNTRWLGWGVSFLDLDLDGWLDLFLVNGHVYPEVEQLKTEAGYKQRKVVYLNKGDGRFEDVTERLGSPVTVEKAGRGAAYFDFDNDGDVDVFVNNVHDTPDLYRLDVKGPVNWLTLRLVGVQSNRSAIGARVRLTAGGATQVQQVRGGGSYYSQNDLRLNFGLGSAANVDRIEVRWPNGKEQVWTDVQANQILTLKEGADSTAALAEARRHYHADQPVKAIEILKPIVERLPAESTERREAEQILGLAAFATGRYAEAIPHLEATRKWASESFELSYALGQAYIQTQRPDEARRVIAHSYGVAENSAAGHLIAAQVMVRLEMEEQATQELKRALDKDPRMPNANYLLGQMALFRGRFPEAIALTEKELASNPGHSMAWSQLGDAYVRQSKWDEAIAALQKSIWLNPYYSAPYILLGRAYVKKEQPARAEAMLRRAIQYDPNNRSAHYLLAQVLQQTGRADEAKREFEIAEKLTGPRGG